MLTFPYVCDMFCGSVRSRDPHSVLQKVMLLCTLHHIATFRIKYRKRIYMNVEKQIKKNLGLVFCAYLVYLVYICIYLHIFGYILI